MNRPSSTPSRIKGDANTSPFLHFTSYIILMGNCGQTYIVRITQYRNRIIKTIQTHSGILSPFHDLVKVNPFSVTGHAAFYDFKPRCIVFF